MSHAVFRHVPAGIKNARVTKRAAELAAQAGVAAARVRAAGDGRAFAAAWGDARGDRRAGQPGPPSASPANPFEEFFEARAEGKGILKWRHYFELYDRHLAKFVGERSALLEIGVAGGGSLDMWRSVLGPDCELYGVDIDPECARLDNATVFIGDQADRTFWKRVRAELPMLDVVVDDGGHRPDQQRVTFEELLPHLRPGGVYICEDVHGEDNPFLGYVYGLSRGLFAFDLVVDEVDPERHMVSPSTPFQAQTHSLHLYPYLVVVERRSAPVDELVAAKHGSEWPG